ncbi:MAG: hypothetical protein GEV13_33425 [Rhodospirillales bacterium]|nr:hypothetical protein [Rhodospirillales bacterium]
MNALMFAAGGSALILVAALGSVLGQSAGGRKVMKAAPIALCLLIGVYVVVAMYGQSSEPGKECIYAAAHPSDC